MFDDLPTEPYRWLYCQDCGREVRRLSIAEAKKVAADPYNYIVFCIVCRKDRPEGTL